MSCVALPEPERLAVTVSTKSSAQSAETPLIASVNSEAEATEIAQPDPSNAASVIVEESSRCRYSLSLSPHSGLMPSAEHARNPRHFGKLESATHSAEGMIEYQLAIELAQFVRVGNVIHANICRAFSRPSIKRSTSSVLL